MKKINSAKHVHGFECGVYWTINKDAIKERTNLI